MIYLYALETTTYGDAPVVWSSGNKRFYAVGSLFDGTCTSGVNVRIGLVESCND